MRNQQVEVRNGQGKSLVLFQAVNLIDATKNTCKHELYPSFVCIIFYVFYLNLVHFQCLPIFENIFDLFFTLLFFVLARE